MAVLYNLRQFSSTDSKMRIFSSSNNAQLTDVLENAKFINGYDLFTYFPAKYSDRNKRALLDEIIVKRKYVPSNDDVLLTRFHPKQLPSHYTAEQHDDASKSYAFISGVFDYQPTNSADTVEWHMNFADRNIFAYYSGSLLAQDELQVLECPQLASVREYMMQHAESTNKDDQQFNFYVVENNLPYPILVSNVERVMNLDTRGLYGNRFATASKSTVLKSYTYIQPPQIVNIIAIEAPKYGSGAYTTQQVEYILQACFTAYCAAKTLANTVYELNTRQTAQRPVKTNIHTGWFGCGAFGGDRTIMLVLQILAAKMAGIDKLLFHTVTANCEQQIEAAQTCLSRLFDRSEKQLSISELIEKIVNHRFQWGVSNGT